MSKFEWCFSKGGVRMIEPNLVVSRSYLEQSEKTLSKVKSLIDEGDFVWASARMYYSAYYLVSSFLYRMGVKSENHDCSIEIAEYLFEDGFDLLLFKKNRVDSQYYFKFKKKEELIELYSKLKVFCLDFSEKVKVLSDKNVDDFRDRLIDKIEGGVK